MKEERARVHLGVTGMTCAACSRGVEKALSRTAGVVGANVNLVAEKAAVEYDPSLVSLEELAGIVEGAGYGVVREEGGAPEGAIGSCATTFWLPWC